MNHLHSINCYFITLIKSSWYLKNHHIYLLIFNNLYRPEIKWDYPLNLSILISGGKETNKDSLSNGEWSGKSSNLKSYLYGWSCSFRKYNLNEQWRVNPLERGIIEGDNPVVDSTCLFYMFIFLRVGLFGNAILNGWYISSKAKYW
jgi:hypothetical protein